jgi:large subunit ribosomal protein L5
MNRLRQKYEEEVKKQISEEFGVKNVHSIPKLQKVVINMGISDAKDSGSVLEKAQLNLQAIAGQKPVVTKAKKSIAAFKLVQGNPIGLMVTLRGEKMYIFLDKLMNIVLPKVRDFRGVSDTAFDGQGNYNLGLREMLIFPEIDYRNIDKARGMQITINTSAKNSEQAKKLLALLGMPFKKEAQV